MGAPFLARSLREKWGFSTERSQRVRPAEQRRGVESQWQTKSRVPAGDQTGKDSTRNGIVQCRERAALKRRVKRGEKRGFRVRVTTRKSAMRWNHRSPLVAAKRRKTRSRTPFSPRGNSLRVRWIEISRTRALARRKQKRAAARWARPLTTIPLQNPALVHRPVQRIT